MVRGLLIGLALVFVNAQALAQINIDPTQANVSESKKFRRGGQHAVGLNKCVVTGETLACIFVVTNLEGGNARDYDAAAAIGYPRLIDNFRIEHKPSRSFYLNGRGEQQDRVNLAQDEKTFFVVEFEGGAPDIKSVRILADDNQFSGPAEQSK